MYRCLLVLQFLILSFLTQAQDHSFELTFIDSSLCLSQMDEALSSKLMNHQELLKREDEKCIVHLKDDPRPYHAQFVLEAFLSHLDKNIKINLTHFNVFTQSGLQDISLWKQAITKDQLLNSHLVLMTTGGLLNDLFEVYPVSFIQESWVAPTFISSGQIGPGIQPDSSIWPHELVEVTHPFIQLIGANEGQMLYRQKTRRTYSGGQAGDKVRGSSRAAALAAADRLNQCFDHKELKKCLSKKVD